MIRDPLYRQIVQGLEGSLDEDLFEHCAAALLRPIYPSLVPIRGGSDFGMDGAIATDQGPPYPLVTTTGKDVIGNLTKNLKTYVEDGGTARRVVSATSQHLTPRRRNNLIKRAKELGFELVQMHDQTAFADLLYRDPAWCHELLGVTGEHPALSAVPLGNRPLVGEAVIGREVDLAWLRSTPGDRLLVGQPGTGKTFVLRSLVREDWGLFVVDDDLGRIRDAIRAERPGVVIVDDAHARPDLLGQLRHLRDHVGESFSIVATTWPGGEDAVAGALSLPRSSIRTLERLDRDRMVDVVRSAGIYGPDDLIRVIVDQADGRPGLAVTLAYLVIQGEIRDVALGDALSRDIRLTVEPLVGERAALVLAAFALGGDAGMPLDAVAGAVDLPLADVLIAVTRLAAAGVVVTVDAPGDPRQHLAVRPWALRHALVRDVFFGDAGRLPLHPLLDHARWWPDVARTLVGARAAGASVPLQVLEDALERAKSVKAWAEYALLGEAEATWVLQRHPELAVQIADAALLTAPRVVIPLLLDRASGDARPLEQTVDHPIRLIRDWVKDVHPGTGEGVGRRQVLATEAAAWMDRGGDPEVGIRALAIALLPGVERGSPDPGSGRMYTIWRGLLTADELGAVCDLWADVAGRLPNLPREALDHLLRAVEAWAYPHWSYLNELPEANAAAMRSCLAGMLADMAEPARQHPGLAHRLRRISDDAGIAIAVPPDPDFERLFAQPDSDDWRADEARRTEEIAATATRWGAEDPRAVAARIARLEAEAKATGVLWPGRARHLCERLAEQVASPAEWGRHLLGADVSADLVAPFLRRAALIQEQGWEELASACLDRPTHSGAAILVALSIPDPPEALLERALEAATMYPQLVEWLCERGETTEATALRLLESPHAAVAGAAAFGEWLAEPKGSVRGPLQSAWRRVVRRYDGGGSVLRQIFRVDPGIAHDWLRHQVLRHPTLLYTLNEDAQAALEALDTEARRCVLRTIPPSLLDLGFVARLVGDDADLYASLLDDAGKHRFYLAPLVGPITDGWVRKAQLALKRGIPPQNVAAAVFGGVHAWTGDASDMWVDQMAEYDKLRGHDDPAIRAVGEHGYNYAATRREEALVREQHDAVYGRF